VNAGAAWNRRPGALLILVALVGAVAAFQQLRRDAAPADEPFRFVAQAERRAFPILRFVDDEAKAVDLAQWRGKVVLLNIWATWCAPCRKEMPSLERLQAQLADDGLQVVPLSIDPGAGAVAAVRAFYASHGLRHLRIYHDAAGTAVELGAAGVPVTFLLDRQGREIGRVTGAAAWDGAEALALVRSHLAQRAP
jgi:thiol-disulfide isomerase/thioredoxin